jgi:DNA-binding response OmpR family regulator
MTPTRVLVIDDQKGMRDMLCFNLQKKNIEVTAAEDGEKGVASALNGDFDAVVCDIMLPGLDGIAVLRIIKRERPAMEVILVTGFPSAERRARAKELGALEFLAKPYKMETLYALLDEAVARRRAPKKPDSP